jgi:hypothetical protein
MLRPALTLLALLAVAAVAEAAPTGWLPEQPFDAYSPLAAAEERVQRLLAPTYAERLRSHQQRTGVELAEHSLDLANERFDLYVSVRNFTRVWLTRSGHWVPDARRLDSAFDFLDEPASAARSDPECVDRLQASVDAGLQQVERLMTSQSWRQAGELLGTLEDQYGGLLAPRSVEQAKAIAAHLPAEESEATP